MANTDTPSRGFGQVFLANRGNVAAQAPFERGVALLHDFEYDQAAAAFRAAQTADPGFVMAYWGEAMTYNHPLWAQQDAVAARAALARLGPTQAARASKARDAREGKWLAAVEALYGEGNKVDRDRAYADKMAALFESDPNDIDARTFRALSIMGTAHGGRDVALYMKAAALLEEALPAHPTHPGVLHYLIHAYDDPAHAPLGERAARRYALVAPAAGHAQHMVSHIYLALGRWPEVERANVQAMTVVNATRAFQGKSPAHCGHYDEWLAYALLQQGKDASPVIDACWADAAAELAAGSDNSVLGAKRSLFTSWTDMAVRQGIETGHWPTTRTVPAGRLRLADFNLAYASLLEARSPPAAVTALARMKADRAAAAIAQRSEAPDDEQIVPWLDRAIAQGDALVTLARGERSTAIAKLKEAAAAETAMPVEFGPPALAKPSAELLGDQLLKAGRKAEAAEAYVTALAAAPGRRLPVLGLAAARR